MSKCTVPIILKGKAIGVRRIENSRKTELTTILQLCEQDIFTKTFVKVYREFPEQLATAFNKVQSGFYAKSMPWGLHEFLDYVSKSFTHVILT